MIFLFKFQVVLPQASEEYGPISHYYLIVVPEDPNSVNKNPDQFLTEEVKYCPFPHFLSLSGCSFLLDLDS